MRRLINQQLEMGSRLPTELELTSIYGVSRITIRQALAALADSGFVERRHGTGTFVANRPHPVQHDFALAEPWRDRFAADGHDVRSEQLHVATEIEPPELRRDLSDDEAVLPKTHLKRLHLIDERPIGLSDSWVVQLGLPDLSEIDLTKGSVSTTLRAYGVDYGSVEHTLDARSITGLEADHLRAELDSPVFVVWSITRRASGRLLETSRTVWLGTHVRFHYSSNYNTPE